MTARIIALAGVTYICLTCAQMLNFGAIAYAQSANNQTELGQEERIARGIVGSLARAELSTEIIAVIDEIPFRDGDSFEKGDVLVHLSCGKYEAEARSTDAVVQARNVELRSKEFLRSKKSIGQTEVDIARAQLLEAQAQADQANFQVEQCQIKAPFSGKVVETLVNQHELTSTNEPLITIIDHKTLEISLIVPSTWLEWLEIGSKFSFEVDETGAVVDAEVFRMGAEVDAVSQTIKITGLFTSHPQNILAGMSGTALF